MSIPNYFDLDGSPCSEERAIELIQDLEGRTAARTEMSIVGRPVLVSTIFAITDQMPMLYNLQGHEPMLWVTEVIGGPPDMDGTFQLAGSREEALEHHELMVERMVVSGCDLA